VTDFLLNIPDWAAHVWQEAKLAAMKKEARIYAAATRIIAVYRGKRIKYYYKFYLKAIFRLQAHARRKLVIKRNKSLIRFLFEDWLFRYRYYAATLVQAIIRRYIARSRKIKIYKRLNEEQVKIFKANRKRKAKLRAKEKSSIVYKVVQKVNGLAILVCMKRRDQRSFSKDYSMVLEVYVPKSRETFRFEIEESELREFICFETGLTVLNVNQLLDKRNLSKVLAARLICIDTNKARSKPRIKFSKQALGEKGKKTFLRGKTIKGDLFVCTLYESASDVTVQCYHRLSCKVFTAKIMKNVLTDWIKAEYIKNCKSEIELYNTPPLLLPENKKQLHIWMLDNLQADTRHRTFKIIFACQLEKSKKLAAVVKFQSMLRMARVRQHVPAWVDSYIIKVKSEPSKDASCYYINVYNGQSFWEKPKLLGKNDLPTQPYHRWVPIQYYIDGYYQTYYVNPYNGRFTQKSLDSAARMIQSLVRNRRLNMHYLNTSEFQRAVNFSTNAEKNYLSPKKKLSNIINYALTKHLMELDFESSRKLYEEAIKLSDTNPLVLRAYAIFFLAVCDHPIQVVRERALFMIKDAKARDPEALQFKTAYAICFKFGCYKNPNNCLSFLHLGLATYYIYGDLNKAELIFRRAIAMSPFNEMVVQNWKFLRDQFPDKSLSYLPKSRIAMLATLKGGKKIMIHGKEVFEDPKWAGWVYYAAPEVDPDDIVKQEDSYWYNPVSNEQRFEEPDWKLEWEIRAKRSQWQNHQDGLDHYYDPLTSSYFQYHALTQSYQ